MYVFSWLVHARDCLVIRCSSVLANLLAAVSFPSACLRSACRASRGKLSNPIPWWASAFRLVLRNASMDVVPVLWVPMWIHSFGCIALINYLEALDDRFSEAAAAHRINLGFHQSGQVIGDLFVGDRSTQGDLCHRQLCQPVMVFAGVRAWFWITHLFSLRFFL